MPGMTNPWTPYPNTAGGPHYDVYGQLPGYQTPFGSNVAGRRGGQGTGDTPQEQYMKYIQGGGNPEDPRVLDWVNQVNSSMTDGQTGGVLGDVRDNSFPIAFLSTIFSGGLASPTLAESGSAGVSYGGAGDFASSTGNSVSASEGAGAATTAGTATQAPPFGLNPTTALDFSAFPGPASGSIFQAPFESSAGLSSTAFDASNLGPTGLEGGAGSSFWDTASDYWKQAKPWLKGAQGVMNIGGGLMNLSNSRRMANDSHKLMENAIDPHTTQYRDQLAALMADPSSVKNMPGYQFGMDEGRLAIQRQGAASGSGGNEAIALARYTPEYAQNFLMNQEARLAELSRGVNPSAALSGQALGNQMANQALWQLGWGANTFLGGGS